MVQLTADQRNDYYLQEATRTGIHKPILAALYAVHPTPQVSEADTGLGIAPAHQIPPEQVNGFPEQVYFAANTLRSLTNKLTAQGWRAVDLWHSEAGRYSDRFLQEVAQGYTPSLHDPTAARLEASDYDELRQAYLNDVLFDHRANGLPPNLDFLDKALLQWLDYAPLAFRHLPHQRNALIEALRVWRKLDSRDEAIASLALPIPAGYRGQDEYILVPSLLQFIQGLPEHYAGYPHQREALLRLVQLWHQLDSREEAITTLEDGEFQEESGMEQLDAALIAFVEGLPRYYRARGEQRSALTEAFRLWQGLDSRATALTHLGANAQVLASSNPDRAALVNAARIVDRELLEFVRHIPTQYNATGGQQEALLRLVQLWRGFDTPEQTLQSLLEDLRRLGTARRHAQDDFSRPTPLTLSARPPRWTPENIQLFASIIPGGNFSWAEATQGGTRMPPNQSTVDAIVRMADLAQQARDRIGRAFSVTSWYRPPEINDRVGGASRSRHIIGDAIDFYCDGLTGNQLYWALDPWWPGGLGRFRRYPYLCHIDARGDRARWMH